MFGVTKPLDTLKRGGAQKLVWSAQGRANRGNAFLSSYRHAQSFVWARRRSGARLPARCPTHKELALLIVFCVAFLFRRLGHGGVAVRLYDDLHFGALFEF